MSAHAATPSRSRRTGLRLDDLSGWLAGRWDVQRTINDGEGTFVGVAVFETDAEGNVMWRETGRLRLGGHEGEAWRNLVLVPAEPGTWQVRFDDGRLFHALDLRAGRWEAEHLCGADTYRGTYVVLGPDQMSVCWRVTGPRHDDLIATAYRRAI